MERAGEFHRRSVVVLGGIRLAAIRPGISAGYTRAEARETNPHIVMAGEQLQNAPDSDEFPWTEFVFPKTFFVPTRFKA
jgi:hypothetical protein